MLPTRKSSLSKLKDLPKVIQVGSGRTGSPPDFEGALILCLPGRAWLLPLGQNAKAAVARPVVLPLLDVLKS